MTRPMAMMRTLMLTAGLLLGTLAGASAASAQEHSATEVGRQAVDPHKTPAEASQNKVGSLADQVLLYCYHYDPSTGKYGAVVTNIVRLGGLVTVFLLGGFLIVMYRHEPRAKGIGTGRA